MIVASESRLVPQAVQVDESRPPAAATAGIGTGPEWDSAHLAVGDAGRRGDGRTRWADAAGWATRTAGAAVHDAWGLAIYTPTFRTEPGAAGSLFPRVPGSHHHFLRFFGQEAPWRFFHRLRAWARLMIDGLPWGRVAAAEDGDTQSIAH